MTESRRSRELLHPCATCAGFTRILGTYALRQPLGDQIARWSEARCRLYIVDLQEGTVDAKPLPMCENMSDQANR